MSPFSPCFTSLASGTLQPFHFQDLISNTPIQEKTGSRMETKPKGPSVASPGSKYKLHKQSLPKKLQDGATK